MLRAAAQTIGEVTLNQDFGMLDSTSSDIAEIFKTINLTLKLSQDLARKVSTSSFCYYSIAVYKNL